MLQLIIKDASVETSTINGKSGSFQSSRQTAWLELPSGERRKVRVRLGRDAKPYAQGTYTLGDESFVVGEYGDLQLGMLQLIPAHANQQQPRAVGG